MPVRKRNLSRRSALDENAQAWLRGDHSGFHQFKSTYELEALWNEHGDEGTMFWKRGTARPVTLADLREREDSWLASGADDEYGANSYFIATNYNDEEKQTLWNKRGDDGRFICTPGMRRPERKSR